MAMTLLLSKEYDKSYFIKAYTTPAKWWQEPLLKLSVPFYIPFIHFKTNMQPYEDNCFTKKKNREGLSGIMNCSSCIPIPLNDVKRVSKANGVTINDVVICALTTSLNVIFKEKGDETKKINIIMPGNIRFKFYDTVDEVKFENRFTIMPVNNVPIT